MSVKTQRIPVWRRRDGDFMAAPYVPVRRPRPTAEDNALEGREVLT